MSKGYNAHPIDVGHDIAEVLFKEKIECAFMALHGRFGEDGTIQGMLELMGIPYTGSGVLASALAMHKIMSKKIFLFEKIPTPSYEVFQRGEIEKDPHPTAVSPPARRRQTREGRIDHRDLHRAERRRICSRPCSEAAEYDEEILVEEFIKGKEITVGILEIFLCPSLRLFRRAVFMTTIRNIRRAKPSISSRPASRGKNISMPRRSASRPFRSLGCSGCARVDLMTDEEGNPFVIDVNTMPGMTETSLLPQAAAYAGIAFEDLAERILLGAS